MEKKQTVPLIGADGVTCRYRLPFGHLLGVLEPHPHPEIVDIEMAFRHALSHPIGMDGPFLKAIQPGDSVCITVPDWTRHGGLTTLYPLLVDAILARGVEESAVCFLFAGGTHRKTRSEEQKRILGEPLYRRFSGLAALFVHDCDDAANLVSVGETSHGCRLEVNRLAVESTHLLLTGSCVPHYFAGFGGGRKAVLPGISSRRTVSVNHSRNVHPTEDRLDPRVRIGVMDGNPIAEEMLEAAQIIQPLGIINTVLNQEGKVCGLFIGELQAAHEAAATLARSLYFVSIPEPADLVIGSAVSATNWVQSHKCLYNTHLAVKADGNKLLLAPCQEGIGNETLLQWFKLGSIKAVIHQLRAEAEVHGQTSCSTFLRGPGTVLVTEMSDEIVRAMKMESANRFEQGLEIIRRRLVRQGIRSPAVWVLPDARYTIPVLS